MPSNPFICLPLAANCIQEATARDAWFGGSAIQDVPGSKNKSKDQELKEGKESQGLQSRTLMMMVTVIAC